MVPLSSSRGLARALFCVLGVMFVMGLAVLPMRTTYSSDPYALARTFENTNNGADRFGESLVWVGAKVLIGAPGYDPGGAAGAGAAYVYDTPLNVSAIPITLTKSSPITDAEGLGTSVAAFGSQALLGAPRALVDGVRAGAVYVFNTSTGQQVLTMTNPFTSTTVEGLFGSAVAGVGGHVVVGAPGVKVFDIWNSAGEAYRMNGGSGAYGDTLSNPGPNFFESFGSAVTAYGGSSVLIGAPLEVVGGGGTDYGAVYLFNPFSSPPSMIRPFDNPSPASNDRFGASIAVFGNQVLIGAPNDDTAATDGGAAYLFNGDTGQLLHTFTLTATTHTPAATDHFGTAVSLNGQHILIGAPDRNDGAAADAGAAYLFSATSPYSFIQVFSNPSPAAGEGFGSSVAVNTNLFLVGAPRVGGSVGKAYLFSFAPPTATPVAKVFAPLIRRAILPTP